MRSTGVRAVSAALVLGAGVIAGCSDTTNPLSGKGETVSLSFSGVAPAGVSGAMSVGAALADTLVIASGADTLKITSAEVVLRKIELERATTTVNCDSIADSDTQCEEFTIGAMLINVPLIAGTSTSLSVPIDSGTYSKVEFKIHKLGSDSVDLAFFAANPSFPTGTSIRLRGFFNGTAFTFTSSLDVKQEFTFSPALHIDASGAATNLTIRFNLSSWFKSGTGALLNPATAANQSTIENNIKNSIKGFEDKDKDGDERNG